MSPDGQRLFSGSWDGTVRVWNIKEIGPVDQSSTGDIGAVSCVSYVPGSNHIASGLYDGSIRLWDAHTGAAIGKPLQGHIDAIKSLAVSSDGRWIVSGSDDKALRLWDIASRTALGAPLLSHTEAIKAVAVSPNNQLIASASADKTVRLWDVETCNLAMILEGHKDGVNSVAFSVDGKKIISGSEDCTMRVWDTQVGKAVGELGHTEAVRALAVSPDGNWVASLELYGTVWIWSMSTHEVISVLKGQEKTRANSVAFSPDGKYILTGFMDFYVIIFRIVVWNVQTGKTVGDWVRGHTSTVSSIVFSAEGDEFTSGSCDGTIRVWDMRSRRDLELYLDGVYDPSERLRILLNVARICVDEHDGWMRFGEDHLLWLPMQYRSEIRQGNRLIIGAPGGKPMRPEVDYSKLVRYGGTRWTDIYTAKE